MRILMMLTVCAAVARAQYQTPLRISDGVGLPATLNTKVTEWRDMNGSGLKWDARAEITTVSPGARTWYLRDNAGVRVLELQRSAGGVTTDLALLDMNLEPLTSSARRLGSATRSWLSVEADSVYTGNLRPPSIGAGTITFTGNLLPSGTRAIGASGQRVDTIWAVNLNLSGTCTGCPGGSSDWTRNSGSGYLAPTVATDDVWLRTVVLKDIAGSGVAWDIKNESTLASPGSRAVYLRDPAGAKVVEFQRTSVGVATNRAIFDLHLYPTVTNAMDLGDAGLRWRTGYFAGNLDVLNGITANTLNITSGATVNSLNISSGSCTGCPNYWQLTGFSPVTVSPLSTAYNMAIGGSVANTHKLEVTGSASVSGNFNLGFGANLLWQTDGSGSIGLASSNRPSEAHIATVLYTYNGSGSGVIRNILSGSGLIVFNSSGTEVARVSGSTGRISSNAGFTVSGINGLTVTTAAGCVFTGGILTTSC